MNILFIYSLFEIDSPEKPLRSQEQIQPGISYISAVLKAHGHKTKLVVLSRTSQFMKNRAILDASIAQFLPSLVCFTAVSSEYAFIVDTAKYLRTKLPNVFFLIGGVHATLSPDGVLDNKEFDALCIGEGEYPTLELVTFLEKRLIPSRINNLWIKNGAAIEKNNTRPFLAELDSLPFMDREMWQDWIEERLDSRHQILLGRGCPYDCTYCSNHALKKKAPGRYVRFRTVDKIIHELNDIAERFPQNQNIYLEVEAFNIDKQWALTLCDKLRNLNESLPKPLNFGVNIRITLNASYDDLFAACKKSNFTFINIGLESGSERIRQNILKRNYANLDVINTVQSARRHHLKVAFYNLLGIPGETITDLAETVKINRMCQPDWIMTTIFFPYPGTDLYELCKKNGYMDDTLDTTMERSRAVLAIPDLSQRQIQRAYEWFYYDVYRGHRPKFNLLMSVFVNKLRRYPGLFGIYLLFIRWGGYKNIKSFLINKKVWKC